MGWDGMCVRFGVCVFGVGSVCGKEGARGRLGREGGLARTRRVGAMRGIKFPVHHSNVTLFMLGHRHKRGFARNGSHRQRPLRACV